MKDLAKVVDKLLESAADMHCSRDDLGAWRTDLTWRNSRGNLRALIATPFNHTYETIEQSLYLNRRRFPDLYRHLLDDKWN